RAIVTAEREAGAAILLTSHDLADVERLADRIVSVEAGGVVAPGTADELRAGTTGSLRFRLDRPLAPAEVSSLQEALALGTSGRVVAPARGDGRLRLGGAAPDAALIAALAAWCAAADRLIIELRTAGGSLEDVYLDLVATGRRAGHEEVAPGA